MRVIVVPVVIGALGTIPKCLVRRLEEVKIGERVENIQTEAFLGRPEYYEETWRLEETCCRLDPWERPSLTLVWKACKE